MSRLAHEPVTAETHTIYVVEDHARLRHLIVAILNEVEDLRVVGEAGSSEEALADPVIEKADIVLTDLSMPGMDGIGLTQHLHERWPELPILLLSAHSEKLYAKKAFKAGACAYITKDDPLRIEKVIRRVLAGEQDVLES